MQHPAYSWQVNNLGGVTLTRTRDGARRMIVGARLFDFTRQIDELEKTLDAHGQQRFEAEASRLFAEWFNGFKYILAVSIIIVSKTVPLVFWCL